MVGAALLTASVLAALVRSAAAPGQAASDRSASAVASSPAPRWAPPPGAMFSDDFSDDAVGANPPAGWSIADGRWDGVVSDGVHVLRHAMGRSYGHLAAGALGWTDYAVSADL